MDATQAVNSLEQSTGHGFRKVFSGNIRIPSGPQTSDRSPTCIHKRRTKDESMRMGIGVATAATLGAATAGHDGGIRDQERAIALSIAPSA